MDEDSGDELQMIRSLLRAESTRDTSQIKEAHDRILRFSQNGGSSSSLPTGPGSTSGSTGGGSRAGPTASARKQRPVQKSQTPVSRLLRHDKQKNPVILGEETSVREVAKQLTGKRQSAALILRSTSDGKEELAGICSEVDICRRLVGAGLSPDLPVKEIMTRDPCVVDPDEDFSVVLQMMVKHRFRHLPVVRASWASASPSGDGQSERAGICGMVDITQCLYDAIHKIERMQANQAGFLQAVQRAQQIGGDLDTAETEELAQRTLKALMDSISPTVGTVVQRKSLLKLDVKASVQDAALAMKEARMTAVLVFEGLGDGLLPYSHKVLDLEAHQRFVGILTCKDVMARVVGKGLDPANTSVGTCMTPNPDTVRRDSSVLDALHIMQTERYLHLPVVDAEDASEDPPTPLAQAGEVGGEDNSKSDENKDDNAAPTTGGAGGRGAVSVCGILSVLDCAVHTFTSSSGRAAQVLGAAGGPTPARQASSQQLRPQLYHPTAAPGSFSLGSEGSGAVRPLSHQQWRDPDSISAFSEVRSSRRSVDEEMLLPEDAAALSQQGSDLQAQVQSQQLQQQHLLGSELGSDAGPAGRRGAASLVLKVKDQGDAKVYRLSDRSVRSLDDLLAQLERATGRPAEALDLVYLDEDGDEVQLANDLALREARSLAAQQGWKKVDVLIRPPRSARRAAKVAAHPVLADPVLAGGVLVAVTAVAVALGIALLSASASSSGSSRRYR